VSNSQLNEEWKVDTAFPVFEATQPYYAIIEPHLWPEWKYYCYKLVAQPCFESLFGHTQFANVENGPVVIELTHNLELFEQCIDVIRNNYCGCILKAGASTQLSRLLPILRARLIAKTAKGEALLRYYDPRTLLPLLASMSDEERRLFWSPIETVIWHSEQWLEVSIEPLDQSIESYQWRMTPQHIQTMQTILEHYHRSNDS
jgi:hypothetical protein